MSDVDVTGDRYRAPALDKGLDILELLSEQPSGLTRAEIVKAMGRSPSEIYRMLERLVARDYVVRSSGGDRYFLSMKLFVLANRHPPIRRLVAQATPKLDVFARDSRQSCHLVVPERAAAVVVAQTSPMDSWEFRVRVGARLDLLDTGSGHALLAFQSPERRTETVGSLANPEAQRRLEQMAEELDRVRADGYRIGDSGQLLGVRDISVPVLDPNGDAVAVLTCPYISRADGEVCDSIEEALARLQGVARELSMS